MSFTERIKNFFNFGKRETIDEEFAKTKELNKLGILGVPIDKETEMFLTPHTLMFLAYMIVELHPEIFSSYQQYVNFFIGKGLRSRNAEVDSKLQKNHNINLEIKKFTWNYLVAGNAFTQKFYEVDVSKTVPTTKPKLKGFSVIRDSSRVFYNLDAKNDSEYWLYNMHYTGGQAVKNAQTQFQFIKYALQQVSNILEIKYVTKLHKWEISHLRSPYGRNDFYGHSTLMSGWGYGRALKEMIDNMFRIAKYQAIGKKIIRVGDEKSPVNDKEMQELERKFESEEKQAVFMNKPIVVTPLSYQGEYQSMQSELEYIRKALMSGSIPTFLTAFAGDFSNRSLSDDSLIGFFMNLEGDRELILSYFNSLICELWDIKSGDAELYFDQARTFEELKGNLNETSLNSTTRIGSAKQPKPSMMKTTIRQGGEVLDKIQQPLPGSQEPIISEPEATSNI